MTSQANELPLTDPTPIFEHFRGVHATELLTAAVSHFSLFDRLNKSPTDFETIRNELQLERRPAVVLLTALKAMGLLTEVDRLLTLTDIAAEHLVSSAAYDVGNYVGLAAQSPGVLAMVDMLRSNQPMGSGDDAGTAFIYRDGIRSAMDAEESARHFTLALAGRAKNVAPALATAVPMSDSQQLLDIGGGTGIYSYALLEQNPNLRAAVFDRPEVLKVASEMAHEYDLKDRTDFVAGDMFVDPFPPDADTILLSNILHEWDVPQCQQLVNRCAEALPAGGRLLIHDVFLNDALDGPLPVALYSASLFSFTEGRAYSRAEYCEMLRTAGLEPSGPVPTLVHCGVLTGTK